MVFLHDDNDVLDVLPIAVGQRCGGVRRFQPPAGLPSMWYEEYATSNFLLSAPLSLRAIYHWKKTVNETSRPY
jgi:hypothetical protein